MNNNNIYGPFHPPYYTIHDKIPVKSIQYSVDILLEKVGVDILLKNLVDIQGRLVGLD